jgi:hypothetical protein
MRARATCAVAIPIAQERSIYTDMNVTAEIGDVAFDQQKLKQEDSDIDTVGRDYRNAWRGVLRYLLLRIRMKFELVFARGFSPGTILNGAIHINETRGVQAQADASTAHMALAGETQTAKLSGTDLGRFNRTLYIIIDLW